MNKASVLLVDDEEVYLKNLSKLLKMKGYEVMGAHDGPTAIRILEEHNLDVVLMDICMPGMNGIETLREMKAKRPETEVIILTGQGDAGSIVDAFVFGAFDFTWKTLKLDGLIERIDEAFRKKLIGGQRASEWNLP